MEQLTIRNLDNDVKSRLRKRAIRHGCSLQADLRDILHTAAQQPPAPAEPLGTRIARRFAGVGPPEPLEEPPSQLARPATFTE